MKTKENFLKDINTLRNSDLTQDWSLKVMLFSATCEYYGINIEHQEWNEEFDGLNVQNESLEVVKIWYNQAK